MLPSVGKNGISPFLKSDLLRSIPESIFVSKYMMEWPILCAFPCKGNILVINPTVVGERCRFNWQEILSLSFISKKTLKLDTVPASNFDHQHVDYITAFDDLLIV